MNKFDRTVAWLATPIAPKPKTRARILFGVTLSLSAAIARDVVRTRERRELKALQDYVVQKADELAELANRLEGVPAYRQAAARAETRR